MAVATGLQLLRAPGLRPYQSLWAEDGGIFYNEALHHHATYLLGVTYAGYLQFLPRLVAVLAVHLPVSWAAAVFGVSAAVTVSLLSLVVYACARRLLVGAWSPALVTVMFVALPQAGFEVNGASIDVHWFLIAATAWVLVAPAGSRGGTLVGAAVGVLSALSDPLTALAFPCALVGLRNATARRLALVTPAATFAALVLQALAHHFGGTTYRTPSTLAALVAIAALRVGLSSVVGDRLMLAIYPDTGLRAAALAAVLILVLLLGLTLRAHRNRLAALSFAVTGGLVFATTLGLRGTAGFLERVFFNLNGSRYTVLPIMVLWVAVIILVDAQPPVRAPATLRWPLPAAAILTVAWVAVITASDWSLPNVRGDTPTWAGQLTTARHECAEPAAKRPHVIETLVGDHKGRVEATSVAGPNDVVIGMAPVIPPDNPTPLFGVVISCSRLGG